MGFVNISLTGKGGEDEKDRENVPGYPGGILAYSDFFSSDYDGLYPGSITLRIQPATAKIL